MKVNDNLGGNFNWVAPLYDPLARVVFGHRLQQAQAIFLDHIPAGSDILIVGGGTGWLLEQVLTQCQPRRVIYLEASARMLERASQRMLKHGLAGAVDFRVGTEKSLKPGEQVDAVLTPFVLDLFSEQTLQLAFIPQLKQALKPDGLWLVTDFTRPQRWWQKALLWSMIRFFRLTTGMQSRQLANWQKIMAQSGLILKKQQTQVNGMVSAEVWQLSALHVA